MSITVYTTAPDEKSAETLAKEIVVAKLGSCCNFWPVRTIYSWEGELRDDTEHIILIKTSKKKFDDLEKYIVKNHPTPCLLSYHSPGMIRTKPFKDWVNNND